MGQIVVRPLAAAVGLVVVAIGTIPLYRNVYPNLQVLRSFGTADGIDGEAGDELITIDGEVAGTAEEPVVAPLTGRECVACEAVVQRRQEISYSEYHSLAWTSPFRLASEGQAVAVDPQGATLLLEDQVVHAGGEIPEEYAEEFPYEDFDTVGKERWRLLERRLEPGETASVVGGVRDDAGETQADPKVVAPPDASKYLVSDADPATTRRRLVLGTVKEGYNALFLFAVGGVILAFGLGLF